jgi:F-type H+-transporting ATPase subunit delta
MKTPRTRIARLLADKTLGSNVDPKQLSREIAAYLLETRRTGELASLLRDIEAEWAARGYVEVLAYSAHPLTTSVRSSITGQVQGLYPEAKKIIITEVIDDTILGGVKLVVANRQLDLSVQSKLNQFKQLTLAGKE